MIANMNYEAVRIADVDLQVGFGWGNLGLVDHFPRAEGNPSVTLIINIGYSLDGSPIKPVYLEGKMTITIGDDFGINRFNVVRHMGYLAGDVSEKYRFVHAAGINIGGKGVLLIGNSGNGKSTLASLLDGALLDEDQVMVSPTEMRRITTFGRRINKESEVVEWVRDDNSQSPIHYVFLLDNRYEPDHVVQTSPEAVRPEATFDDKLHPLLLERYRRRMPLIFEAPVFEIGTKREPTETKRRIEEIVSQ